MSTIAASSTTTTVDAPATFHPEAPAGVTCFGAGPEAFLAFELEKGYRSNVLQLSFRAAAGSGASVLLFSGPVSGCGSPFVEAQRAHCQSACVILGSCGAFASQRPARE